MVEFDDITVHEEQVASTATALLALEQASRSRPDEGRLAVSSSPVEPVAIIRTAVSLHLGDGQDPDEKGPFDFTPLCSKASNFETEQSQGRFTTSVLSCV